jgi:spore coat protein SA
MGLALICTEKLPVPPVRGGAIQTYLEGVLPYLTVRTPVRVIGRTDPLLPDREVRDGAEWIRFEPEGYADRVVAYLRAEPAQQVVVYNRPLTALALADALPEARLFLSLHNEMLAPDRIDRYDAERLLNRLEQVICISDYIRQRVADVYPAWAAKLVTIRSGVDLERFQPGWALPEAREAARDRLGLTGKQVLLHVSRFSPKKGNHLVLAAMSAVRNACPEAALLLVGSRWYGSNEPDAYATSILEHAASLGPSARVTGWIPPRALPPFFLAADLFVCASQWAEPLARVHYEAMAAGLPILTTDRGGNGEVIQEGENGRLVRPHDDPAAFAQVIIQLLQDPIERERLGRNGRRLAERAFGWARVGQELAAVLSREAGRPVR